MAITTQQQEYKRLRSYLNPYIRGKNVDAVLNALAAGASSYLINNAAAVNDQLYIVTASGRYLDQRLADYGITRPPSVGLSDEIFSQIGIEIKNRKQVRDLINQLLNIMFGDSFCKATSRSAALEPYDLNDGDTLIINFDSAKTATIEFKSSQFTNIHAATAQEVADAITTSLVNLGYTGSAISNNDGNGNYVELISSTIGPASSITVLGGAAQNQLQFPAPVTAGGNMSTQWTVSLQSGSTVRFTWTGGANPNLGRVSAGNYVNIFGGGFSSSPNEGSYTILTSVGGAVGDSYFEISNPLGSSGIVVQGDDNAILFYNPIRQTLTSNSAYAAVYQTQARILQIFMPAATRVIRRSRLGSAHLHDPQNFVYSFATNANAGDLFAISTANTLVANTNFAIGANATETSVNLAAAINQLSGVAAAAGLNEKTGQPIVTVFQDDPTVTLVGTYTGSASITSSGLQGDPNSSLPNQQGPYMYDTTQPFTVSSVNTVLAQDLNGTMPRIFQVQDASNFPNSQGFLIFGYGTKEQEGPVPYISVPSSTTILISPTYTIKQQHNLGSSVTLIAQNSPVTVSRDGFNYPFYITDVVSGRTYAQDLINSVAATGIKIVFTILYPSDIGLGKWGTQYSENPFVWGQ